MKSVVYNRETNTQDHIFFNARLNKDVRVPSGNLVQLLSKRHIVNYLIFIVFNFVIIDNFK